MRFPFVSVTTLDAIVAAKDSEARSLKIALVVSERREADLLAKYHDLMQRRANTEHLAPAVLPAHSDAPDLVLMEVAAQAKGDPMLHRYLTGYVGKLRAAKVDEGVILRKISQWESSDDDGVPETTHSIARDGAAPEGFWPDDPSHETPMNPS